ncbi:hypothetical protein HHI36_017587 [Cryptolaemus montrouzieri]|uniref:Uncharacterized protein n=1 Tax=Cryptolaemus montrouzieri TaxID=559131 RepID=A0ABD2NMZ1_9CUCU
MLTLRHARLSMVFFHFTPAEIKEIHGRDERLINEHDEMAEEFNEYFSECGKEYAEKIKEPKNYEKKDKFLNETSFMYPTDKTEIESVNKQLKDYTEPG